MDYQAIAGYGMAAPALMSFEDAAKERIAREAKARSDLYVLEEAERIKSDRRRCEAIMNLVNSEKGIALQWCGWVLEDEDE